MEVFSPKVLFYLEHRKQIEEWAKIRSQASDEMHRWLSSWAEVMEESDLDGDRHFFAHTEGTNSPKIFWYRKEWQARPEHVGETGRPLSHTGIGFEWHRNNPHGKRGLHAGIFVQRRIGPDKNQTLQNEVENLVNDAPAHAGSRKWWPYYEFLEPVSEVVSERVQSSDTPYEPEDLDEVLKEYRNQQIQLIEDLWGRYADRVSEAVARAYPPPSVT